MSTERTPFDNPRGNTAVLTGVDGDVKSVKRDPFALPPQSSGESFGDFEDELLLIQPYEVNAMVTQYSQTDPVTKAKLPSEFVRVNVISVDRENERYDDILVFQAVRDRLKRFVPKRPEDEATWVLGRLARGEKKPGQDPPYILEQPTAEDYERGKQAMIDLGLYSE